MNARGTVCIKIVRCYAIIKPVDFPSLSRLWLQAICLLSLFSFALASSWREGVSMSHSAGEHANNTEHQNKIEPRTRQWRGKTRNNTSDKISIATGATFIWKSTTIDCQYNIFPIRDRYIVCDDENDHHLRTGDSSAGLTNSCGKLLSSSWPKALYVSYTCWKAAISALRRSCLQERLLKGMERRARSQLHSHWTSWGNRNRLSSVFERWLRGERKVCVVHMRLKWAKRIEMWCSCP